MKFIEGKLNKAQKVVIYGPEGIGKSTFALSFPEPIVIDVEGSTANFEAKRFEKPNSWTMLMSQIQYAIDNKPCKTLIIDTVDYVEQHLTKPHIVATIPTGKGGRAKTIEDYGYGSGYVHLADAWGKMLNKLQEVIDVGINVVLCGHAQMRKFEQPDEMGAYDRWELKLEKRDSALTKEWADMVLFANYKTMVVATDTKKKATGGKRTMYTTHHPAWDAKNRHNLPEELDLDYISIQDVIENRTVEEEVHAEVNEVAEKFNEIPAGKQEEVSKVTAEKTNDDGTNIKEAFEEAVQQVMAEPPVKNKKLAELMELNKVTTAEITGIVSKKGYYPTGTLIDNYENAFIEGVLIGAWPQVFEEIKRNRGE